MMLNRQRDVEWVITNNKHSNSNNQLQNWHHHHHLWCQRTTTTTQLLLVHLWVWEPPWLPILSHLSTTKDWGHTTLWWEAGNPLDNRYLGIKAVIIIREGIKLMVLVLGRNQITVMILVQLWHWPPCICYHYQGKGRLKKKKKRGGYICTHQLLLMC